MRYLENLMTIIWFSHLHFKNINVKQWNGWKLFQVNFSFGAYFILFDQNCQNCQHFTANLFQKQMQK